MVKVAEKKNQSHQILKTIKYDYIYLVCGKNKLDNQLNPSEDKRIGSCCVSPLHAALHFSPLLPAN